jgi:hypothetical protein
MARTELIRKLNSFLNKNKVFKEECQVVYLLVEIRKILEHDNETDYKLLRFFCDWTVHTKKDRKMEGIVEIVTKIDNLISSVDKITNEQNEQILKFLEMNELRKELSQFLTSRSLPKDLYENDHNWSTFVNILAQVLSGQPILDPIKTIKSIEINSNSIGSSITVDFGADRGSATAGFGK